MPASNPTVGTLAMQYWLFMALALLLGSVLDQAAAQARWFEESEVLPA